MLKHMVTNHRVRHLNRRLRPCVVHVEDDGPCGGGAAGSLRLVPPRTVTDPGPPHNSKHHRSGNVPCGCGRTGHDGAARAAPKPTTLNGSGDRAPRMERNGPCARTTTRCVCVGVAQAGPRPPGLGHAPPWDAARTFKRGRPPTVPRICPSARPCPLPPSTRWWSWSRVSAVGTTSLARACAACAPWACG